MQTAWEFTTIFMKPNGRPWTQLEQLYDSNTPEYPVAKLEQENVYIYTRYIYITRKWADHGNGRSPLVLFQKRLGN